MIEPRYIANGIHLFDEAIYRHDGDSFCVHFDLGQGVWKRTTNSDDRHIVRLNDVDCPEKYKPGGPEAKAFTEAWLTEASTIDRLAYLEIQTLKRDSFGRWLAYVRRICDGQFLHEALIKAGHDTGKRW